VVDPNPSGIVNRRASPQRGEEKKR